MAKVMKQLTPAERLRNDIVNKLSELGGKAVGEKDVEFGEKFQAPKQYESDIPGIVKFWQKYQAQMEEPTRFQRQYQYKPWDGAVALRNVFQKYFGTKGLSKVSFFEMPQMIDVHVGVNQTVQVPWGAVSIPIFQGTARVTSYEDDTGATLFLLLVDAPKKYEGAVQGLFRLVQTELEENSIYRGKAFDGADMPNFLDLSFFKDEKVIYNEVTMHQLAANIWVPILYPDLMEQRGIDKKRAVLLKGTYGTGKTLAAMKTAKICEEQNRTFIMCNPKDNNVYEVLNTAAIYQPSTVFIEDIDVLTSQGDDQAVQEYLDKFDGLTAKGKDIIAVMTTNNIERIHKGMLRPGRLDAVIDIGLLDRGATEKLIKSLFRPIDLGEMDYDKIYESVKDFTPAFIKETCEKVKLYAIARSNGDMNADTFETLDFLAAAEEMRSHHNLHIGAGAGVKPEPLSEAVKRAVAEVIDHSVFTEDHEDANKVPGGYAGLKTYQK